MYIMIQKKTEPIKIVVIGAGGFGREVIWTLNDCNKNSKKYEILGYIDNNSSLHGKKIDNYPVLGGLDWFLEENKDVYCIIAIGDSKTRYDIFRKLESKKIKFATIIHPSVISSKFVEIGEGTIIQAGSIITPDTKIGNHVHINMDCSIAHDCDVKDFVTISPGVHINGNNVIGKGSFFGTGAVTIEKITVGEWSVVGAGTVLVKNVPEFSLYVGVPGKLKKKLTPH